MNQREKFDGTQFSKECYLCDRPFVDGQTIFIKDDGLVYYCENCAPDEEED